jgi:hypothetical protein
MVLSVIKEAMPDFPAQILNEDNRLRSISQWANYSIGRYPVIAELFNKNPL